MNFLDYFPNTKFRYIKSGSVIKSDTLRPDLNKDGYDSYFTVNGFTTEKQEKEDVKNINAFFIDIDGRKDKKEIEHIKSILLPTFIIETGKGYHIYWMLDEPAFKDEMDQKVWDITVDNWEIIERTIVETLKGDPAVKDLPRILRVPNTFYWKNYIDGLPIKIKGIEKNPAAVYSMAEVADAFPIKQAEPEPIIEHENTQTTDWFRKLQKAFPIEDRDSFKRLISGDKGTIFPSEQIPRHTQLMAVATYMLEAGMTQQEATDTIIKTGWHGLVAEKRTFEIQKSIEDVYKKYPLFGRKKEHGKPGLFQRLVELNRTDSEQELYDNAVVKVIKDRKEQDKARYGIYEKELAKKYPHTLKNDKDIVFMYINGVYEMMMENTLVSIILRSMEDDMLFGYRTPRYAKDKISCWLSNMEELALTENDDILNVRNGLLDMKTLALSPHSPDFISLYQSPIEYDPKAKAPTWERALNAWTAGDEQEAKITLLQQFVGYVLMPTMKYAMMLFLVGDGGNGKSTFVDTIAMMVGSKGTSHVDLDDINSAFGLQRLVGSRLNIIEEISGNYYKSNKLKGLVSGEPVTINIKYAPQFDMRPEAKFIFAVNEMPKVDDNSQATERRTLIVMFNNNFRDNPNIELRSKSGLLSKELPGILNWALKGVDMLKKTGFVKTKEHSEIMKEYREESNSFEAFIADCTESSEGSVITSDDLYSNYTQYCVKNGFKMVGKKQTLTKIMKQKSTRGLCQYLPRKNNKEENSFEGIQLTQEWESAKWNHVTSNALRSSQA